MAIISFWSEEKKETGQTLSMAAICTYMAIAHNYRILAVSTNFNDAVLENCFWDPSRDDERLKNIKGDNKKIGLDSGIEGLIKIIQSNKTSSDIIGNYTNIVFKNRLDILPAPKTINYGEYCDTTRLYSDILSIANKGYDLVFVDIGKQMPEEQVQAILAISDVVIVNLTQRLRSIDNFLVLRENNDFFKRKNIMLAIGRYDKFSKYSNKNITRYIREKKELSVIPYNTLFFEACGEGKTPDFFLRLRKVEESDRNAIFIKEVENMTNAIIYKIQELQMRM